MGFDDHERSGRADDVTADEDEDAAALVAVKARVVGVGRMGVGRSSIEDMGCG